MPHLLYKCHGCKCCLDDFSCNVSTLDPGETLPLENFVHLTDKDKGLLEIAAHACQDICNHFACTLSPANTRHVLKLVVEDDVVLVLNNDFGLHQCTCPEVIYRVPRSLSRCILSGWEIWLERLRRWEALFNLPHYRSPSPDLPNLAHLFTQQKPKKRGAEEIDEASHSSDSSSPSPPPTKRMRTGLCANIVKKIAARKAADGAHAAVEEGKCTAKESKVDDEK
ncbi:hypothetical protein V5O48_015693 [Marasmius crinis-equi]|uniref:Uncharacterized protein n=1 Tax=Marasmius crinis-equi TaxID=585013 RepID=A0ABR3ETU5_9AGAR